MKATRPITLRVAVDDLEALGDFAAVDSQTRETTTTDLVRLAISQYLSRREQRAQRKRGAR